MGKFEEYILRQKERVPQGCLKVHSCNLFYRLQLTCKMENHVAKIALPMHLEIQIKILKEDVMGFLRTSTNRADLQKALMPLFQC